MADQNFSVNCGFFDAVNNDRLYSADDMNKPYSRVIADGVFAANEGTPSSDLQTLAAGGMAVTVQAGQGIFASKWFENPSAIIISIPANNQLNARIDSIIAQVDKRTAGRIGSIVHRTGTASSDPQPPAINETAGVVEYRLANIEVGAGVSTITDANITDLRGSESCPWVTSLIQQVSTSTLWTQFQAAYQAQFEAFDDEYHEYEQLQRQAWEDALAALTDELTVSTNITMFSSTFTASGSGKTTVIPINIASYDPDTDVLLVFINGILATPDKYTYIFPDTHITLTSGISAGNTVHFLCLHALIAVDIQSTISMIQALNNRISSLTADSGWASFTPASPFMPSSPRAFPEYRKIGDVANGYATVYLRGEIMGSSAGAVITTLPVGYRPDRTHFISALAINSGAIVGSVALQVNTSGELIFVNASDTLSSGTTYAIDTTYLAYN
jgi:hypothetical protein